MKTKPPPDRRKFAGPWDEIDYLYHKLLYWLYRRADPERARPYAERLERALSKADPHHEAILGEGCWSLVCETKGDLQGAIKYRENEIRLIQRLRQIAQGNPCEGDILKGYSPADLSDRYDLLATLHHDSGELDKAIRTLERSKRLCQQHGVKFDGEELLRDYQNEKRNVTIPANLAVEANGHIAVIPWASEKRTTRPSSAPALESGESMSLVTTTRYEAAPSEQTAPLS
jgi:hypothetical protein